MTYSGDKTPAGDRPLDFIREIIAEDNRTGKHDGRVITRFPPEPNGYAHIGHAQSICLNLVVAGENPGRRRPLTVVVTNPTQDGRYDYETIPV